MELIGYFASVLIGVSLGLIGGGGSILTVPVLVYLFGIDAILATTYSLFVVGLTSAVGSFTYFKKGLVNIKMAMVFGLPSIVSIFITRHYILPAIPQHILNIGSFELTKNILLMLLFAILMILASVSMLKKSTPEKEADANAPIQYINIAIQGAMVGLVTGLVGAGGGFLIIPALVNFLKMPIKSAIGTSLLIIALNSLIGFSSSLASVSIEWTFLLSIAAIAVVGIFIGTYLSSKIDGAKLKPAFGWFVLLMGIYIITNELILK